MKILCLTKYNESEIPEAPAQVAGYYRKYADNKNHTNIFVCYFQEGSKYSRIQKLFGFLKITENFFRSGIFPLIFTALRFKPDIIHLLTLESYYLILFPLKYFLRFKLIYTMHGAASYELIRLMKYNRCSAYRIILTEYLVLKHADRIAVLSNRMRRYLTLFKGVPAEKTIVGSNGIEMRSIEHEAFAMNDSVVKLCSTGNINRPEKGYRFLLDSLALSAEKFELTVFSTSRQAPVAGLEIPANVKLILEEPLNKDIYTAKLVQNHLFVAASRYDVFNMSLLEAMNAGMLVVSSDRVGLTERFDEQLKMLLVPYGNKKKLSEKIIEIVKLNETDQMKLRDRAREFSEDFYWSKIIEDMNRMLYET